MAAIREILVGGNMKKHLSILFALVLGSCGHPEGATWFAADFNKYDLNYAEFQTEKIVIGQSKEELISALGLRHKVVEMGDKREVLAFERWASVGGPDYVEQRLLVRIEDGAVKRWRIVSDTVEIVPRRW